MYINPLNPTGRFSGLFYRCIYPTGLYSGQMAKTCYGEILRVERFNGYCMVVYLYIYIALHAVHTNQKRFQCKRPREKSAVLRERKEVLGSPVRSRRRKELVRVKGRSWLRHTELVQISHHTRKANSDSSDVH